MNSSQPAGWYPDPRKPTQDRYWDGSQWTNQTRKAKGGGLVGAYRRFPTWVQIGLPIIVVLILIGAVAGGEESDDSADSKGMEAAATTEAKSDGVEGNPAENASDDNTPSVGPSGSVEVDTLRWRLRDASTASTIGNQEYGLGAKANGVYVVAELSVTNNKSESVTLTSESVSLVAGDNTYETDANAETALVGDGAKTFFLEDIGPEVTVTGKVAFDVSSVALKRDPQLRFNELGFGDTHGYIALPKLSG